MTFNWTGGIADYDTPTAWGGSLPGNNSTAVILAGMPIITAMDAASLPTSLTFQIGATLASLPLGSTAVFQPGAGLELDDATLLSGVTIDVNLTGGSPFEGAGLVAAGNAASDAIINIGAMDVLGIGVESDSSAASELLHQRRPNQCGGNLVLGAGFLVCRSAEGRCRSDSELRPDLAG